MVQRKIFPAYGGYNVAVASEQMKDGKWAAVATITHSTGTGQRIIDLPIPDQRFEKAHFYRKTPLFDRFLKFEVKLEPDDALRH